jgi:hypothetical protein
MLSEEQRNDRVRRRQMRMRRFVRVAASIRVAWRVFVVTKFDIYLPNPKKNERALTRELFDKRSLNYDLM